MVDKIYRVLCFCLQVSDHSRSTSRSSGIPSREGLGVVRWFCYLFVDVKLFLLISYRGLL